MLDHIVLATADVPASVAQIEAATGIRAALGGRFSHMGVYNHLLSLGDGAYLEIIGPDPEAAGGGAMPFGMTAGEEGSRVATWAAKAGADIGDRAAAAKAAGCDVGEVMPLARDLPDGGRLEWELTMNPNWPPPFDGLVPFLINWGDAIHPSTTAVGGVTLAEWYAEHPNPAALRAAHAALGVELDVRAGNQAGLVAVLSGPAGSITLR